ncbi:hypothetical protein G7054_g5746 [Neopestalotiopsis clavispora]|nr:hypothetical protein G7054_g5746 [Neopestalotiopsis clavispora]
MILQVEDHINPTQQSLLHYKRKSSLLLLPALLEVDTKAGKDVSQAPGASAGGAAEERGESICACGLSVGGTSISSSSAGKLTDERRERIAASSLAGSGITSSGSSIGSGSGISGVGGGSIVGVVVALVLLALGGAGVGGGSVGGSGGGIRTRSTDKPPEMEDARLRLVPDEDDPTSSLSFPTVLLYPADLETDFIKAFNEQESLSDHLAYVFPLPWDQKGEYTLAGVECYMDTASGGLIKVGKKAPLLKALSSDKVEVVDEVVKIFVLPKAKAESWVQEYKSKKAAERGG